MTTTYQERWNAALMNNYGTPALELVKGSGAEVWDSTGRRYLDLVSGVAVNSLGASDRCRQVRRRTPPREP